VTKILIALFCPYNFPVVNSSNKAAKGNHLKLFFMMHNFGKISWVDFNWGRKDY
jgi:hypothetical protein